MVSASLGMWALADELSPLTGVRTPPLPDFEASCPGEFPGELPPSSRMTQRPQPAMGENFPELFAVYSAGARESL